MTPDACPAFVDQRSHNIFHFRYGFLEDRSFWISSSRNAILRIDKFTLDVLMDLNTGKSVREVAKKYNVEMSEITNTYKWMEQNGFVVAANFGKIKRVSPVEDVDIAPYLLGFLILIVGQFFYFTYAAKTILMGKVTEGVLVAGIAILAIFFHEFGHYFFCWKYTKVKPAMKFGLARIFPIVYVDTNLAWCLPRNKKLIINSSGIFFDVLVNTAAVALVVARPSLEYYVTPFLLTQYMRIAILVNPVLKGDGYWLLSDIFGIINMEKRGIEELKKFKMNLFSLYGLISVAFSVLAAFGLMWFLFNLTRPLIVNFVLPFFQ